MRPDVIKSRKQMNQTRTNIKRHAKTKETRTKNKRYTKGDKMKCKEIKLNEIENENKNNQK